MYTKNLTAHRGTDNQILIEFVNQDQKRVDVTGMTFTVRLISADGTELLLEKNLEDLTNAVTARQAGQMKLVLLQSELDVIQPGKISYSIEQTNAALDKPIFVDEIAGARGVIDIYDSILPSFVPSTEVVVPLQITLPYLSSIIREPDKGQLTFQIVMDQFVGDIIVQHESDLSNAWTTLQTETILTATNLYTFNLIGYYNVIRLALNPTSGSVTKITYR